jgi:hypothetical protein
MAFGAEAYSCIFPYHLIQEGMDIWKSSRKVITTKMYRYGVVLALCLSTVRIYPPARNNAYRPRCTLAGKQTRADFNNLYRDGAHQLVAEPISTLLEILM